MSRAETTRTDASVPAISPKADVLVLFNHHQFLGTTCWQLGSLPCHRLIGADGSLVKYGGGLERKRWLLRHEGVEV
jgi:hypothetical protein